MLVATSYVVLFGISLLSRCSAHQLDPSSAQFRFAEISEIESVNTSTSAQAADSETWAFEAGVSIPETENARYSSVQGNLKYVDPLIGTAGPSRKEYNPEYGGTVPSPSPPFAAVRLVPMTRENFVSSQPYYAYDDTYHGAMLSRQPAVWMGDYGFATISAGLNTIRANFTQRGLPFSHEKEFASAYKHTVLLDASTYSEGAKILVESSARSHTGYLQYTFSQPQNATEAGPNVVLQATRAGWRGAVFVDPQRREIAGWNPQRMDYQLGPHQAQNFKGYFVARFDCPFASYGTSVTNLTSTIEHPLERARWNEENLSAYATFAPGTRTVRVRIGMSLISINQARANLETEISDGTEMEDVVQQTMTDWKEKVDRIEIDGAMLNQSRILYTGLYHALQFPSEHHEPTPDGPKYYSAYTDSVHAGVQYQGYSVWDVWRAEWALLILLAPERISDMTQTLLDIYEQSGNATSTGYLPMWANLAETNIMEATFSDSLIAEALVKGVSGFNMTLAWEAVVKDAEIPPDRDEELQFADREQYTPIEARAGLTYSKKLGWVPHDKTSESGTRTLDHAICDYCVGKIADLTSRTDDAAKYLERSKAYVNIYNNATGFMQPRFSNGTFLDIPLTDPLGRDDGFTEGNRWAYTFDVPHDIPGLSDLLGGNNAMAALLDRHFAEGHNDQSNEPSHHIPYLYAMIGHAHKTQVLLRTVAQGGYSDTYDGYSGNEDCGQQSAWYFFTAALGMYPVMPASGAYVVGSPFFDRVTIRLPGRRGHKLLISAPGAQGKPYIKSLRINGKLTSKAEVTHRQILEGGAIEYEMSDSPTEWGR